MAITFDQQDLLIGCDNSHYMSVFDLDLLTPQTSVAFTQDYVQSVAASANAILARFAPAPTEASGIDQIDMIDPHRTALPTLGVWQNKLGTLIPSGRVQQRREDPGGQHRRIGDDLRRQCGYLHRVAQGFHHSAGAYAASNFDQFVVGNTVLDSSGAPKFSLPVSGGYSSGFAFVNQGGYFTTRPLARPIRA